MADNDYTGHVYAHHLGEENAQSIAQPISEALAGSPPILAKMASVVGAFASLALVVGIGVWGYKLIVRDVSGIPVVRALEGPMRVQPDDPGGVQADNQGLAVNAVAATGSASAIADRLVLAPRPVGLSDEDTVAGQQAENGEATPSSGPEIMAVNGLVDQLIATPESAPAELTLASVADDIAPEAVAAENQPANFDAPDVAEGDVPAANGMKQTPRPRARPARLVVAGDSISSSAVLASAVNAAVDAVALLEVDPDSLAVGTRLAQLGAYDSPDIARSEWDRLNGKFGEYMKGKQLVIQQASSGGRNFYRLRAVGFTDLSDARRFCSALIAENTDCIPVTIR